MFGGMKKVMLASIIVMVAGMVVGSKFFDFSTLGVVVSGAVIYVGGLIGGAAIVYMATANPFIKDVLQGNWDKNYGKNVDGEVDLKEVMSAASQGEVTAEELLEEEKENDERSG